MAHVNINVDTYPLAQKVDGVTASVATVGTAVTLMQNKLVQTEMESAEKVSNNVTYGFYLLSRNQFAQKAIDYENEVVNAAMEFTSYSKRLSDVKARMQKDYSFISSRYYKHFDRINRNMGKRLSDMDRHVFQICSDCKDEMGSRSIAACSNSITYANDIVPMVELLDLNILKRRTSRIINILNGMVSSKKTLQRQFRNCLGNDKEPGTVYVPVVVFESQSMADKDRKNSSVMVPNFPNSKLTQDVTERSYENLFVSDKWVDPSEKDRKKLKEQFCNLLKSVNDKRKADLMLKLFEASALKTPGR